MGCPEAEQVIGVMAGTERAGWVDHAAGCDECRAVGIVMGYLPDPAESGPRVGRYILGEVVGRGAMGVVYAARDPELEREVAVKVHATARPGRLRREARALARLSHPNVVQVHDVGEHDGRAFVAMELVDGESLRAWLRAPRPAHDILSVIVQAGRGLSAAHAAGLIHRDFKPDNLLLARDGRVLVTDFGLACAIETGAPAEAAGAHDPAGPMAATLTATGAAVGTPAYMAPEHIAGEPTMASDQYAFCVTAWEALFGVRPYGGTTVAELRERVLAGRIERPADRRVARSVEAALRRGLAARASDRFPSMDALLAALAPRRVTRRHGVAAALAIAGIATVAWLLDRGDADRSECDAASDAIATTWNRDVAARLVGPDTRAAVSAIEAWVSSWRSARRAACRAASERAISASVLAGRTACYERARATFDASLAGTLAKPRGAVNELSARLPSIDPCASDVALPIDPGVVDTRGCRCPYSACSADGRCLSACDAPAFRVDHLLNGISLPGRQELLLGVSLDGDTVLYLAGEDSDLAIPDVSRHCSLRHLFVARRRGAAFAPVELTQQIDDSLGVFEACCTLAPDGRSIVASRADRRGFVRLALDGDRLVRAPDDEFAALTRDLPPDDALQFPLLSPDQRVFYYRIAQRATSPSPVIGSYTTSRREPGAAFPPGRLVDGVPYPAHSDEYLTGVSEDGLTLFLSRRFNTYALVRASLADAFHEPEFGSRLAPWRLAPLRGCRHLIANVSIGGCEAEDIAVLSAAPR